MKNSVRFLRAAAAAAALGAAAGCGDDSVDIVDPPIQGGELFRSYVSLGNSITAGYQSGGINDSTQRESYAYLLARQFYGVEGIARFRYPSLANPGCPPPITNFQTRTRVAGTTPSTGTTCLLRDTRLSAGTLNNVAVPNAYAVDLTRTLTPINATNPLNTLILGGRTQVARALEAQPTFASVWIGNNEVLLPANVGRIAAVPGASPGVVPVDTVARAIGAIVDSLVKAPTLKGGVLVGVVDVRSAPRYFPGDSLLRAGAPSPFKFSIDTTTGRTVTVLPNCVNSGALVSSQIIEEIRAGTYPPIISCAPATVPGVPATALLGDLFIINPAEQTTLATLVAGYNAYIRAKADSVGWGYLDPNSSTTGLPALRAQGVVPLLPRFTNNTAPYGTYFSIDGAHPRLPTHAFVANALIDVINAKYGVTVPKIQ